MDLNVIFIALLWCISCLQHIGAISFHLPANIKKCLKEEIHKDVLVTGEYELSDSPGHSTLLEVTDSVGHVLYQKDDAGKGKFAFTTDDYDTISVCFNSRVPTNMRVEAREASIDLKHGVEARNYEDIAKAEKLKPLEVELRRLEDLSKAIVSDFSYMKAREEEMRDTNESTNSRVLLFSVLSMVCLLSLATWQVFYLRRYFKAKKLIE